MLYIRIETCLSLTNGASRASPVSGGQRHEDQHYMLQRRADVGVVIAVVTLVLTAYRARRKPYLELSLGRIEVTTETPSTCPIATECGAENR
jgi:hypothetical protein